MLQDDQRAVFLFGTENWKVGSNGCIQSSVQFSKLKKSVKVSEKKKEKKMPTLTANTKQRKLQGKGDAGLKGLLQQLQKLLHYLQRK